MGDGEEAKGGDGTTLPNGNGMRRGDGQDGEEEDMQDDGEQQRDSDAPGTAIVDDTDSSDDEYENQFALAVITDLVKTPLVKQDEFTIFSQAISAMAQ
jgi:hypothetical protein